MMTMILNIAPDLETQIRHAAAKAGVTPDTYVANLLEQHLRRTGSEAINLSETETGLLQQINLGLSQATWQLHHELINKRRAETLTPAEQKQLIEITDELEMANARRMSALVKLAQHRQISLEALMDELGIKTPTYD
jgi:hypothetical protein